MPEDTGLDYASEFPGRMHACGHDSHTAMLVQAVHLLHRHRDELAGTVKFMFQPGEEGHGGARLMIEDGLIDADPKPDAAFALHIWPNRQGRRHSRPARPDDGLGRLLVDHGEGARRPCLDAASTRSTRCRSHSRSGWRCKRWSPGRIDVFDPVVLTCAKVTAGTANNVIPETAEMVGTLASDLRGGASDGRTRASVGSRQMSRRRISARPTSRSERGYPVTVNDPGFVDFARDCRDRASRRRQLHRAARRRSWAPRISPTSCSACPAA